MVWFSGWLVVEFEDVGVGGVKVEVLEFRVGAGV
jgi:hypothetical protein